MFMIFPSQNAKLIYSVESLSLEPMQDVGVVYLTVVTPFEYMEWSLGHLFEIVLTLFVHRVQNMCTLRPTQNFTWKDQNTLPTQNHY